MEALECIRERRSVRRFSDAPVTREEIKHIVDTARFAPTWKNSQTVRYMAVLDPALKGRIAAEGLMGFERRRADRRRRACADLAYNARRRQRL